MIEESPSSRLTEEKEEEQQEEIKEEKQPDLEQAKKEEPKLKKGVVYLSRIPPYMNVNTLRRHFKTYGVERIYLEAEKESKRKQRERSGGNKKRRYVEGWIEFTDKQDAKTVARLLNGQRVGGKKQHNPSYDDIWCIRYLSKFSWEHLHERTQTEQRMRAARLKQELSLVKKESAFYLQQVDLAKKIEGMQAKRGEERPSSTHRKFKQKKPILNN